MASACSLPPEPMIKTFMPARSRGARTSLPARMGAVRISLGEEGRAINPALRAPAIASRTGRHRAAVLRRRSRPLCRGSNYWGARRECHRADVQAGAAAMKSGIALVCLGLVASLLFAVPARAQSGEPDLIFRKSTTFKLLTPNDKLAVYGVDDPAIDGVACHYTAPEKGGLAGAFGLAEQTSDISLCLSAIWADQIQGEIRAGRCRVP